MNYYDLFSSNIEDSCSKYKSLQKDEEIKKEINNIYNSNIEYLDNEFKEEFSKEFFSRLFELFILKKICKASLRKKLSLKIKSKTIGPDFTLKDFINNRTLHIECVSPKTSEKIFKKGSFDLTETGVAPIKPDHLLPFDCTHVETLLANAF